MDSDKFKVRFFYRKKGINYSIERVFDTIYSYLINFVEIDILTLNNHKVNPIELIANLIYCYKNKITGINHVVGDIHYAALVLPRKNTILTIHDMVLYHSNKGIKRLFFFLFWYYLPCKKVNYVTCISESTKYDLINIAKCNPKKIILIPNPVNNDFKLSKKEFNVSKPVILHIGTRENKNIERVIEALNKIPCHLKIIGRLSNNQIALLKKNKIEFSNSIDLTNEEVVEEYNRCDIVSFPSLFEGFGLPIIEGQAVGRIILTSNLEPMKSLANGSAVLVNPYDVLSIKKGFEDIISDFEKRQELFNLGLINIKRFNPELVASSYFELYKSINF